MSNLKIAMSAFFSSNEQFDATSMTHRKSLARALKKTSLVLTRSL